MFLGVTIHATIPYITDPGADAWPARSPEQGVGFDLIAGVIHSFRMQLFFLLCGFFARLVHERSGTAEYVRHRLMRIGVPFALGMLTIVPVVHRLWNGEMNPGATAHLWFLEYLLIYSLAAVLFARITPSTRFEKLTRFLFCSPWKPFLLALPTAALMMWSPIWDEQANARGTTFLPNGPALVHYGLFFIFGWAMHRQLDLLPRFGRGAGWQLALGLICLVVWGLGYRTNYTAEGTFLWTYVGSCPAWLFSFGMIALFQAHFDNPSRLGRYLADSAYWVYLAHLPLIIALQKWIVPAQLNPWLELLLIHLIALPLLLLSYHYLVRRTFLGQILNGRRYSRDPS